MVETRQVRGSRRKPARTLDPEDIVTRPNRARRHLRMPANLLSLRIQQSLSNDPKRLPFKRVPGGSPAAKQREQQLTQMAADHAVYSTDAIVIVNFQKFGDSEQTEANTSYGNEMGNLFAEGGHGPVHIGKAIKLEGDAEFDQVGHLPHEALSLIVLTIIL